MDAEVVMKVLKFKSVETQPSWITNASQHARNKLGLYGNEEDVWIYENLGCYSYQTTDGFNIVFEEDKNYTSTILRWS